MKVRFYHYRGEDESVILADFDLPAVPAHGETIILDDTQWTVHAVAWNLDDPDEVILIGLKTLEEYRQNVDKIFGPLRDRKTRR